MFPYQSIKVDFFNASEYKNGFSEILEIQNCLHRRPVC